MSPGAGATIPQNPINKAFQEFQPQLFKLIATFLQQTPKIEDFLTTDTRYLQKINNNYYIVLIFGKKVYKKTLKTSNQKKANIRKLKILQHFKDKLNMNNFSMSNDMLQVITIIEEEDDVEEAKRVIKQINSTAMNGVSDSEKLNKITTITEEEIKYSKIENL